MEKVISLTPEIGLRVLTAPMGVRVSMVTTTNGPHAKWSSCGEDTTYPFVVADPGKGVWSETETESIKCLKKSIISEVKRLEKNDDLRPSQTNRLTFLKGALDLI